MSDKPTGNPVFDFKAGFRSKAATLQRVFFFDGIIALIVGVALRAFSFENILLILLSRWLPLAGLLLIAIALIWGFAWRSKLRDDFRRDCN